MDKANQHPNYAAFTIIAILFPVIAVILGIVFMAKEDKLDKKVGEHALALGLLFTFIWYVVVLI